MPHNSSLLADVLAHGARRRPLVGAHRGASARAPENTLTGFRAALDDGADLVELDVRLTRDGQLAVIHDATTRRTTGTRSVVANVTMERLRGLDAGYRGAAAGIPELGDVFDLTRGRALVNIEVKGSMECLPILARRIDMYEMHEWVIVSSFDPEIVRAAALPAPRVLTGLLVNDVPPDAIAAVQSAGASLLHVRYPRITADLVETLHGAGIGVLAWTVNRVRPMRRLQSLGVDTILSDNPRLLRETIAEQGGDGI